jgi:hypothetical protein
MVDLGTSPPRSRRGGGGGVESSLQAAFAGLITLISILSRTRERKSLTTTFGKKICRVVVSAVLIGFQNLLTAAVMADSEQPLTLGLFPL